jgi:acetyl esterase/lipase
VMVASDRALPLPIMDDGVQKFMRATNDAFPAVETMTAQEARAFLAGRRLAVTNLGDVASADDQIIAGPGGDLRVRIYRPHGSAGPRPAVVFAHGGGFVLCDVDSHDGFCRAMSRYTQSVVVSVDYRLAPEHRAPAAAEDMFAAFRWVADHADQLDVDRSRLLVAGDSAGGNLAGVTTLMCRERGGPTPAGQVLIYPAIEPFFDTESYRKYSTGYVNTRDAMQYYWREYLNDKMPSPEYLVAPARAESHEGLSPAVVVTAGFDVLQSEGGAYARRLRAANVPVLHRDYPGLFHGFVTMMDFGAGETARELLWSDIRRLLAVDAKATA